MSVIGRILTDFWLEWFEDNPSRFILKRMNKKWNKEGSCFEWEVYKLWETDISDWQYTEKGNGWMSYSCDSWPKDVSFRLDCVSRGYFRLAFLIKGEIMWRVMWDAVNDTLKSDNDTKEMKEDMNNFYEWKGAFLMEHLRTLFMKRNEALKQEAEREKKAAQRLTEQLDRLLEGTSLWGKSVDGFSFRSGMSDGKVFYSVFSNHDRLLTLHAKEGNILHHWTCQRGELRQVLEVRLERLKRFVPSHDEQKPTYPSEGLLPESMKEISLALSELTAENEWLTAEERHTVSVTIPKDMENWLNVYHAMRDVDKKKKQMDNMSQVLREKVDSLRKIVEERKEQELIRQQNILYSHSE